jgi:hypothetical protein
MKPRQRAKPFEPERSRKELGLRIQRLVAETIRCWKDCGNAQCRRERRCAGDGYECIAKWRESLPPPSPQQAEARLQDFRLEIAARKRLGGDQVTAGQLRQAIRKEKAARGAAMPPQGGDDATPVAGEMQLAAKKQERIDEACNEPVVAPDRAHAPGPRIRRL